MTNIISSMDKKITAVIPTYNRCPFAGKDTRFNPLWWAANSLFQETQVGEIIFIDDCSSDNIEETIAKIDESKPSGTSVVYARNEERKGSGISRNLGVNLASNEQIFFYDDDCIFASPDILSDLKHAFDEYKKRDPATSAMTLPVSGNSLGPRLYPSNLIGKVDRNTGVFHGCYSKYPLEYARDGFRAHVLHEREEILEPLEVELMGGVFLCDKSAFQKVGGFSNTPWRNACAEEPELMLEIQRQGGKIFYLPSMDRSFRVIHLRYGDSSFSRSIDYQKFSLGGISLKEIVRASSVENRNNHGNRVEKHDEIYSNIISNARLLFKYRDIFGEETGFNHLRTRFFENVEYGQLNTFRAAVRDGIELMLTERIIDNSLANKIRLELLKD